MPEPKQGVSTLLDKLASRLSTSTLVRPCDASYDKAISRWSTAASKPAAGVLFAKCTEDISQTVVFCRDNGIDLAVRGGGHSTSGASSTNGGVVIDLSLMCHVAVHGTKLVVQGGCIWGDVDEAASKHGMATVGGTVHHTGVGGLTLGGGYGWLSGLHGLTIDNLISAKLVLADGQVVMASKLENADLFWGVCGAGHNFGVAVEFVFQAHPMESFWGGLLIFSLDRLDAIVDFFNATVAGLRGEGSASLALTAADPSKSSVIIVTAVYFGPEQLARSVFAPLLGLSPLLDTTKTQPYPLANRLLEAPFDYRVSMKGGVFRLPLRKDWMREIVASLEELLAKVPDAKQTVIVFEGHDYRRVCARGTKDTAFNGRHEHYNVQVVPFWKDPNNDETCRQWARNVCLMLEREYITNNGSRMSKAGTTHVAAYGNYDHSRSKASDLFGSNYPRLQLLKLRYDPTNLFNKLYPITPANSCCADMDKLQA